MAKKIYRGDAVDVAQQTLLPAPPEGFEGRIRLGISNKFLEFSEWNRSAIANDWNTAAAPELQAARASVVDDGVLLTATTPGVPFLAWITYGSDNDARVGEVLLLFLVNQTQTTSGTYTLIFGEEQTVPIAHNATAAIVAAALLGLAAFELGDFLAEDTPEGIRIEFQGRYAGENLPDFSVDYSNLRGGSASITVQEIRPYSLGVNELQRITINNATGGTWSLRLADQTLIGTTLAYDISAGELEDALEAELGAGNVTVTEVDPDVFDVEFLGDLAEQPQGLMIADFSNLTPTQLNSIWRIDTRFEWISGGIISPTDDEVYTGFFYLSDQTGTINSYDLLSGPKQFLPAITAVLNQKFGAGNYLIRKDVDGVDGLYEIELVGQYAGIAGVLPSLSMQWHPNVGGGSEEGPQPVITVVQSQTAIKGKEEKQLLFIPPASFGQIRFRFGSVTTSVLNYDFGAVQLQNALNAVFGAGNVSVTGNRNNGFEVTYHQSLGDVPLPEIVSNTLLLIPGGLTGHTTYPSPAEMRRVLTCTYPPVAGMVSYEIVASGELNVAGPVIFNFDSSPEDIQSAIVDALTANSQPFNSVVVTGSLTEGSLQISVFTHYDSDQWGVNLTHSLTFPSPSISITTTQLFVKGQNEKWVIGTNHPIGSGSFVVGWNGYQRTFSQVSEFSGSAFPGLTGNFSQKNVYATPGGTPLYYAFEVEFTGLYLQEDAPNFSLVSSDVRPEVTHFGGQMVQPVSVSEQVGSDAANVKIIRVDAGSPELGEQQLILISGNPHHGTWIATISGNPTTALQYNASAGTVESAFAALVPVGSGNVIVTGDHEAGWLLTFDISLGDVPDIMLTHDLSNTRAEIEVVRHGTILKAQELVRSAGKWHFDDPLNWRSVHSEESKIPDSEDEVIYESGRVSCLYGTRQRATFVIEDGELILQQLADFREGQKLMVISDGELPAGLDSTEVYTVEKYDRTYQRLRLKLGNSPVSIASAGTGTHTIRLAVDLLSHYALFTGQIGLPKWNANGYTEYLPTALMIGMDPLGQRKLTIGQGNGSSSGRLRFDIGNDVAFAEIHKTSNSVEAGIPSATIAGTNNLCSVDLLSGDLGLGYYEGEEFHFTRIRVNSGKLSFGRLISASNNAEINVLGGSIDGREMQFTGRMRIKR